MSQGGIVEFLKDFTENVLGTIIIGGYGIIQKYDSEKMLADVLPLLKQKLPDGKVVNFPVLANVPVSHAGSGDVLFRPDYKKGDLVQMTFSTYDRATARSGKPSSANGKLFGLENATITNAVLPSDQQIPSSAEGLNGFLIMHKDGDVIQQILSDKIVFHFGSAKTTIDASGIKSTGDFVANSETVPLSFVTHGHATPVGPTTGKIPNGEP